VKGNGQTKGEKKFLNKKGKRISDATGGGPKNSWSLSNERPWKTITLGNPWAKTRLHDGPGITEPFG